MKKLLFASSIISLASLLTACGTTPEPIIDTEKDPAKLNEYNKVQSMNGMKDPEHGKEAGFRYGAMEATSVIKTNGVAFARLFEDATSTITVNLNIEIAQKESTYSAWLGNASSPNTVELGTLESIVGDARHSVKKELATDVAALDTISVYKVYDNDANKGVLIAKGIIKSPRKK